MQWKALLSLGPSLVTTLALASSLPCRLTLGRLLPYILRTWLSSSALSFRFASLLIWLPLIRSILAVLVNMMLLMVKILVKMTVKVLPHGLRLLQILYRFCVVCLFRSSVVRTPLCMACWALRVPSVSRLAKSMTSLICCGMDGIGAFRALEARALGQATGESVEGILTRLLGMQLTDDLKVMLETHATLFRRLQNFPTVTIDMAMVLKFSLLRLNFRDHPAYPRFAGIEASISQPDVEYAHASRRILDAYLRSASSQAGAAALMAAELAQVRLLVKSVGTVVPLVRFGGMDISALLPTLVSLTPVATVAAKVVAAKVVARVVAKVVKGVAWPIPVWWTTLTRHRPSQTPRLVQRTRRMSSSRLSSLVLLPQLLCCPRTLGRPLLLLLLRMVLLRLPLVLGMLRLLTTTNSQCLMRSRLVTMPSPPGGHRPHGRLMPMASLLRSALWALGVALTLVLGLGLVMVQLLLVNPTLTFVVHQMSPASTFVIQRLQNLTLLNPTSIFVNLSRL